MVDGTDRCREDPPVPNGDFNCVDDDQNGYVDDLNGFEFLEMEEQEGTPNDDTSGHGTHVAGIIVAVANNQQGVAGVMPSARLVALRIFDDAGVGTTMQACEALEYALANGIYVSNNSYGFSTENEPFRDCVAATEAAGHVLVASAGNTGSDTDLHPHYPSGYSFENIVSVAATNNDNGLLAEYYGLGDPCNAASNFGPISVDLEAPGRFVYSTDIDPFGNAVYGYRSGTSMAAPHVTGVVGLVWSRFPGWTMQQVRDRVLSTGRKLDSLDGITVTGRIVNAYRAVYYDCNGNGVDDAIDIANGASPDCTGNETDGCVANAHVGNGCDDPDIMECVCETSDQPQCCTGPWDETCVLWMLLGNCSYAEACNTDADGVADECRPSADCQPLGAPGHGVLGAEDLVGGTSPDCNTNCVPDECEISPDDGGYCDGPECLPDCQLNGTPDICDVDPATGGSCDFNSDGIPDECSACCLDSTCHNREADYCVDPLGGVSHGCLTCGECTCGVAECCKGDQCTIESDCACLAAGGFPRLTGNPCGSSFCELGACCKLDGTCNSNGQDGIQPWQCDDFGETYVGGARCSDSPCEPLRAVAEPAAAEPDPAIAKNRFISFQPGTNGCRQTAIRMKLDSLYTPKGICSPGWAGGVRRYGAGSARPLPAEYVLRGRRHGYVQTPVHCGGALHRPGTVV